MQAQTVNSSRSEELRQIEKKRARLYAKRAQTRQRISRIQRKVRRRAREKFATEPAKDLNWLIYWVTLGLADEARSVKLYGRPWEVPRLAGPAAAPGEEETPWRRWNREIHRGHSEIRQYEKEIARLEERRRALIEQDRTAGAGGAA